MDDEEAENMAKLKKNYTLDNIEEKDFPLFLTVKRLVQMIDGTLTRPFFERKADKTIIGSDTQAQWHNEVKGLMMISDKFRSNNVTENDDINDIDAFEEIKKGKDGNDTIKEEEIEEDEEEEKFEIDENDLEEEYERYQAILEKQRDRRAAEEQMRKKSKMSFEVDYEYFVNHFWNDHLLRQERPADISPMIVWSEIISSIKGSAESHRFPGFALTESDYINLKQDKSTFLNQKVRTQIYKVFTWYEDWKKKESAYDFMDLVNYILSQITSEGYNGTPIHFTMVDEIQDLSHATALLLMKITEQNVFFAGDTAQTIAKGIGFRFSALSNVFSGHSQSTFERPTLHQLTVNFRSHGRILDMANSIVTLMESFFPKTIDRLKKEKSELDGPKPILLEDVDQEMLFEVLFGTQNVKNQQGGRAQGGALEKPPIEFGCNQAIIVRDQASKDRLPAIMKHALCLTVYEAKGLEFDDIILYNFFSESPLSLKEWSLMNLIDIEEKIVDKDTYERHYFTYKEEQKPNGKEEQNNIRKESADQEEDKGIDLQSATVFGDKKSMVDGQYAFKKVSIHKRQYEIYDYFENYGMVCNEFKQLYVAVTRPRNRIIIYDDNVEKRKLMERYWNQLNLVETVKKSSLASQNVNGEGEDIADDAVNDFKSIIASTSKEEWKKQGLKMFRNKYYEQAVKCFEKSEDKDLLDRATAYMIAEKATNKLTNLKNTQRSELEIQANKGIKEEHRKIKNKQIKHEEKLCYDDYQAAADIFISLNLLRQGAQCLFSAGNYEGALEIYEKMGMLREAGEACFMLKQYDKTAELFLAAGDFMRAIEAYEMSKNYDKILEILENRKDLPEQQRVQYAQRYVSLALKKVAEKFEAEPEIKVEKQPSSDEEVVDVDKEADKADIIEINSSKLKELTREIPNNLSEMSFEVVDKPIPSKNGNSNSSFVHVNNDKDSKNVSDISFEQIEEPVQNFDHLSEFDLDDEFLKSESGSIIDAISLMRKNKSEMISEFSAVEYNYIMNNQCHLVETKADIFVQDAVMEKIIKYISTFYPQLRMGLDSYRSKDVLLSESVKNHSVNLSEAGKNNLYVDSLTIELVYFILDILEQNKLYKLCIFVCNRYNIADKLGRYLVDMAFKYSTFAREDLTVKSYKIYPVRTRQIQQEKAFVAHLALHNVLGVCNPAYLKLKKKGEVVDHNNSLGDNCFISLISLGFWKKCLFMMDYVNSLALASAYASFN